MTTSSFKSALKDYFFFWRPSLSRRLTLAFTIFGLAIGYAVYIYLAVSSTNAFIHLATNSVQQYLNSASRESISRNQGELLKMVNERMTHIANATRAFQGIFPPMKYSLYFNDGKTWQHTYMNQKGEIHSEPITSAALAVALEETKTKKIIQSASLFYGMNSTVNVKINITPVGSDYTQIFTFDVQRQGFLIAFWMNIAKALLFFLILLLVSRLLGQIFSARLARPVERLSREAEIIASGDYERRFTTGRKDEIGRLAEALNIMASRILDSTKERENIFIGILIALTRAIDAKSPWTAGHSERVTKFAEAIGRSLHFNEDEMRALTISAILHDIGKIAVPEQILDKPGRLTDEEFDVIKKHPQTGADIIASIPSYESILTGIVHHHERWDGKGYPRGLSEKDIPLIARIICIADVYDALTEDRPYRKAWSREQVRQFFEENRGKMFDSDLVDIFLKLPEIGTFEPGPRSVDIEKVFQ
ncbi:MAG: HD-GYP domain-containing protein [Smithella sp.]|nr:HD-GYP domain-containing protein [Smithella sp.]HOU50675.1 HD-GYP domain-containing protein [Smithella sp.]HQI71906.1 HD-GYP domain-containing protein [Smithella sp.]